MSLVTDAVLDGLIEAARAASRRAYCPYSRFAVGAAVLTPDGHVHSGCNVENASYGLTICAERNAIARMVAETGGAAIEAVAIYTPTAEPTAPCGACRQVIHEFGPGARVVSVCDGPTRLDQPLAALLPHGFGASSR